MDSNTLLMIMIGIAVAGGLFYVLKQPSGSTTRTDKTEPGQKNISLQLQAYERLALLVDRIAIPNLIGRTNHDGLSAREMQFVLTKNIRDEFEYNITQQIYVTSDVWNAIKNLKEKNLFIINHTASALSENATGLDLNRALLDFLITDQQAKLPGLVSEAISYEAKKLL